MPSSTKIPLFLCIADHDLSIFSREVSVRNSLPARSSLDCGCKAWVLKAEVGGGYDESDDKSDDDGLYRQCCECYQYPEP